VKVTAYFEAIRNRPDRAVIRDEWIERAITQPIREIVQADGRIRRWVVVPEMHGRYCAWSCWPMVKQSTTRSSIADFSHEDSLLR
jgi:hypothetical protein